ncbi:right-handed parallel beta-helix repeat-containing protein [Allochromatium palmeri]|uniref:Right handed beta helix domain-containing protein n=1 Tax=Allochromatium palmeri TaxID=231048 RepID=A0A6N8EI58_9GAMM|nr:right-handed parallel beta-helix repeat-containing protein [Allochromatium palmeri]MTW22406.1 hypothetical protein [Allochromatium palmeri]
MFRPFPRWPLALIGALGLLASSLPTQADDFCVHSATELQNALSLAAFNQTDDRILLVQGTYNGNFLYTSTTPYDLEVLGGYVSGCGSRVQDPANTVLDGGGTSTVLILIARELAAKFNIDGLKLQNGVRAAGDKHGGGLRVETAGSFSLGHSVIANNSASENGGGVYILSSQVTLDSNVFTENTAKSGGGGYVYANRVDLTGNRFANNTINSQNGGGIYLSAPYNAVTTVTLDRNEFLENSSPRVGGGAYLYYFDTVYLTENSFTNNTGGGVSMYSIGTTTMTENSFANNRIASSYHGGGAHVEAANATLTQNSFTGNISAYHAGGLYLSGSNSATLNKNDFFENTAENSGGGVFVSQYDTIYLARNQFSNNTVKNDGGGAYIEGGYSNITLTENEFSTNSALEYGGAANIYMYSSNNNLINLVNNLVVDNEAGFSGGGFNIDIRRSSRISLVSNALLRNSAGAASPDAIGGGLALSATDGTLTFTNNTLVQNDAPAGGGVGMMLNGEGSSVGGTLRNNLFWANRASPGQDLWINNDVDGDFAFYPLTLRHNNFNQTLGSGISMTIPLPVDSSNQNAVDPLFADITNDDLTLLNDSPMVNAGDPTTSGLPATDVAGRPRLVGQVVDIGAYENPTGDPNWAELNVGLEGNGVGTVTSEPTSIDCGTACNSVFAAGTEVTLTATTASADMVFGGWSGACSGAEPTCTLTLNEATVVIATFIQGYPITTQVTPSNAGTIDCDPNPVPSGQSSLCTARPASGYGFTAWSGDCTSTTNHRCTLTSVNSSKSVTAGFTATTDLTASQNVATNYVPGGLLTVTAQFNDTSGAEVRGLTWLPELPASWTVTSATGDGSPQVINNEILFTGNPQLPIDFSYQIRVPEDARGDQQLAATLSYQSADMTNPVTLTAEPDPLPLEQLPVVRHSADYQDPPWHIDANEASRVLGYWRAGAYHIDPTGVDGYNADTGSTAGARHSADFREPHWRIDSFEANRVLGYWRAPSYYAEPQGDDGYAPGGQQNVSAAIESNPLTRTLADTTAPSATQSSTAGHYTPGATLTITNTIGQSGDDPLLALMWVPTLPNGWTLSSVSGTGSPELSPTGTEILFTASGELTLPLTFSYTVQVPITASGSQNISAEFIYQRLGMLNAASASATPNPLILSDIDTDTGGDCRTDTINLSASMTGGSQALRSEIGIQVAGSVSVASGATLDLTAPRITFAPSFRVEAGGRLMATSAPVTCTAAAVASAQNAAALIASAPAAVAPGFIAGKDALPSWLQEHLAELSIDTDALTGGLLDADERWLILETTQTLHPEDGNEASDLYRLDLLTDHIALISVTEDGSAGNGASRDPAADTLGERVVFSSAASDLVPGDENGVSDLFLRDLALGLTERLTSADQASAHPAVDAEGTVLVYDQASFEGPRQILGQALLDGASAEVVPLSEADAWIDAHHPAISADGRFLAYLSQSSDGDGTSVCTVEIRDFVTGLNHRQACPAALATAADEVRAAFSPDGRELHWHLSGQEPPISLANPLGD